MQPSELRIGNIVQTVEMCGGVMMPTGILYRVYSINRFSVDLVLYSTLEYAAKDIVSCKMQEVAPVTIDRDRIVQIIHDNDVEVYWLQPEIGPGCNMAKFSPVINVQMPQYLHQFQNLHHAITGKEMLVLGD